MRALAEMVMSLRFGFVHMLFIGTTPVQATPITGPRASNANFCQHSHMIQTYAHNVTTLVSEQPSLNIE
jgi:hypothetical protein